MVITQWDWADPKAYLHDEISTDKRNPSVNANGLVYGSPEESRDYLPVLDPVHNSLARVTIPYRDADTPGQPKPLEPSPIWGEETIWDSHTTVHNPMFDGRGRLWYTSRIRGANNPDFCKAGSNLISAKLAPVERSGRQLAVYDPKTGKTEMIDTCFGTHHLLFAEDANNTLWTSSGGGGGVVGWLNTKVWDQTHDSAKSQGWTALILDTNGNGKRDAYVEAEQRVLTAPSGESLGTSNALNATPDPNKDTRLNAAFYGLAIGTDGAIWGSVLGFPGGIVRLNPGSSPPETTLAEYYEVPFNNPRAPVWGYSPRGMDIDRNNVVWVALGSGHLASFDRRKCKAPLNGPTATGQHCPEGWTLYQTPGPKFKNVSDSGSDDSHYYDWVDQYDTLGLGKNTPIVTGNSSDSLIALVNGSFIVLRVPYPLGFFAKGMDGRIDDAKAGWKGKGVWTTWGTRAPFHSETGKGTYPKVVHFQMRPDPLGELSGPRVTPEVIAGMDAGHRRIQPDSRRVHVRSRYEVMLRVLIPPSTGAISLKISAYGRLPLHLETLRHPATPVRSRRRALPREAMRTSDARRTETNRCTPAGFTCSCRRRKDSSRRTASRDSETDRPLCWCACRYRSRTNSERRSCRGSSVACRPQRADRPDRLRPSRFRDIAAGCRCTDRRRQAASWLPISR